MVFFKKKNSGEDAEGETHLAEGLNVADVADEQHGNEDECISAGGEASADHRINRAAEEAFEFGAFLLVGIDIGAESGGNHEFDHAEISAGPDDFGGGGFRGEHGGGETVEDGVAGGADGGEEDEELRGVDVAAGAEFREVFERHQETTDADDGHAEEGGGTWRTAEAEDHGDGRHHENRHGAGQRVGHGDVAFAVGLKQAEEVEHFKEAAAEDEEPEAPGQGAPFRFAEEKERQPEDDRGHRGEQIECRRWFFALAQEVPPDMEEHGNENQDECCQCHAKHASR